uniref:Uncharacterized protein n=1 Tax=Rhizophora mucronata TaxID=61149 RepID=A0A2P2N1K2_RHIMU
MTRESKLLILHKRAALLVMTRIGNEKKGGPGWRGLS